MSLTLYSPAKVNLFLKILSKREDGYHNLYSLFQTVSLFDKITLTLSTQDHIETTNPEIPKDGSNLALKAASIFRKKLKKSFGISISIEKNIPIEAGLGGGSSNAATVLYGLNELMGRCFSPADLIEMGSLIGSDVPFFFSEGRAICFERGNLFKSQTLFNDTEVTLVRPPFGLKTEEVYRALKLDEISSPKLPEIEKDIDQNKIPSFNDLEKPAFLIEPRMKELQVKLKGLGFDSVLMSGSGSSFICMGKDVETPDQLWKKRCHFIKREASSWYIV